ncbi:beta-N-acetylhexosaminidase [Marinitoga hydrogenitolerans DSM 16785]|uniref:Beta-N-acetylhexosaminidase n=1 Tax=Marinitoga hydrogenitolerans (strain DSM 16785 / JCM 12826 / AT1271) TaxID=1122195 RepID=A0A1M4WHN2_MARH1|nr:beta-N-acetylhexosaminidase [Marinitoga hydrogenitolerans]SHE80482.1 beta-N-acetylhexosaminidase [Marinitoga hydrogenitolerans DSM 16785]
MNNSFKLILMGVITITQFINNMSLKEKIGELFLFGFDGTEYNNKIQELIDYGANNFILFSRNVKNKKQVKKLIKDIKAHTKEIPPFIAIDQEGGMVARIRDIFVPPNMMVLGALNNPDLTYKVGYFSGKSLKELGINMNFSPVLDVNSNPYNPIIGVRSFWNDEKIVAQNGIDYFRGLLNGGVIPVGKHFPGHGDTEVDSHKNLPIINKSKEQYEKEDIYPFKEAIKHGIPAIMTAHILLPFWDNKPATLSKKIISYLRNDLNFKGVIISDDLLMGAVAKEKDVCEVVKESLLAGVNMFIIWKDIDIQKKAIDYIMNEVKKGNISEEIIDNSLEKIISLKLKYANMEFKDPNLSEEELENKISKGIAVYKGNFRIEKNKKYLIFFPTSLNYTRVQERAYLNEYISKYFDKNNIEYKIKKYNISSSPYRYKNYIKKTKEYDGIIFFTIDVVINKYVSQLADLVIEQNKNNLIVAIQSPYDYLFLKNKNNVSSYIMTYDWNEYFAKSLFEYLYNNKKILFGNSILK